MIVSSQGQGHYAENFNNQDFGIETPKMLLVLDGCSGAKYSEIGTRLFAQLFSRKEESDSLEKFEKNAKEVFEDILSMMRKYYPTDENIEEFIMDNLLFTIIACFETEDKFVVKLFGDGYIITKNQMDCLSYIKFSYGSKPPYLAYKYCESLKTGFEPFDFKTFEFDKKYFKNVGIGSDGIAPFAKRDVVEADQYMFGDNGVAIKAIIQRHKSAFYDDVTIGFFGGGK